MSGSAISAASPGQENAKVVHGGGKHSCPFLASSLLQGSRSRRFEELDGWFITAGCDRAALLKSDVAMVK